MRFASWIAAVATAVVFSPRLVQAADVVSAKFDGVYTGQATVNPALSAGSCEPFSVGKVVIIQGNLRTEAKPHMPWLTGLITEDGYVKGSMARPGGARSALEGRLSGDTISAGFIEAASMCAWLIELKREP